MTLLKHCQLDGNNAYVVKGAKQHCFGFPLVDFNAVKTDPKVIFIHFANLVDFIYFMFPHDCRVELHEDTPHAYSDHNDKSYVLFHVNAKSCRTPPR